MELIKRLNEALKKIEEAEDAVVLVKTELMSKGKSLAFGLEEVEELLYQARKAIDDFIAELEYEL